MDIKWLKTFIAAANYENFRKASEELFLTQPAVTKHIKKLEEHLHIQLFERKGKHVFLTSAGFTFLSSAVGIVEKYEEEMEKFEGWKQGYHRKLTIAAAPQIAASVLPSFLRSFIHDHPNIEVIINVLSSFKIGEEISSGQADIGLTRLKPAQMEICCETVHEERVIFVAPYREKADRNEKEVLHSYRLLTNNHPAYWEPLLRNIKKHYPRTRTMPVTQVEVTKRMIEEGLGVSYLPLSMIKEELQNKRIVEIQPDNVIPPNSFTYVVTKIETPEVEQFKQSLIASFF
ncbi:LysR family transcriptional regulator [Pseudobacillus wudalianchiensis]|uniref:Transcriptional regulator n=1 Tax=Pseudobacillus wudalianchiensis TaxID=1743143 RepID=A0A1B9AN05_9BACI|nr:LysR family transcriptional regulator [Bacillus wudalianchiensis]OCA85175.1 transcriptional regulator [Bacillus wudalianchiensis]